MIYTLKIKREDAIDEFGTLHYHKRLPNRMEFYTMTIVFGKPVNKIYWIFDDVKA